MGDEERVENSNTAPFPLSRVIELNLFMPERMRESIETSINGRFSVVVAPFEDVNVILLSVRVPSETAINEWSPVISL